MEILKMPDRLNYSTKAKQLIEKSMLSIIWDLGLKVLPVLNCSCMLCL